MKLNRLAVFIENKSGNFYQVCLTEQDMDMVANLISQMQDGAIKIRKERYDGMSFGKIQK